jgi:hypothetical protein
MQRDFDDLARDMAAGQTRRGTLKQLLLGAVGIPVAALGSLELSKAEAKNNNNKDKDKKKKVTLCHNGQTITVSKNAKKKHLRHGDTIGPCQDTPACTPETNPCGNRKCGTVDNGCGIQVPCGQCTDPQICNNNTGQCGCTPDQNPCGNRKCGSVDNGCGQQETCGSNNGACTGTDTCTATGECICTPIQNPCGDRVCGTVDNGCGTQVQCGADNGNCPVAPACNSAGNCGNDGLCTYTIADAAIGSPCGQADTGVCVQNADGSGSCIITNNGTESCIGADPCGEVNAPRQCATSNPWGQGDCGCYSTTEEGGICLRRITSGPNAFTYPFSAVGCFGTTVRPACNSSADCASGSVCAPLDELGTSSGTCCAGYEGFRGACIQVATDICTAPAV